jgi:hypothetical protein
MARPSWSLDREAGQGGVIGLDRMYFFSSCLEDRLSPILITYSHYEDLLWQICFCSVPVLEGCVCVCVCVCVCAHTNRLIFFPYYLVTHLGAFLTGQCPLPSLVACLSLRFIGRGRH